MNTSLFMKRVRKNAELLRDRLVDMRYEFPDPSLVVGQPSPDFIDSLKPFEAAIGKVPKCIVAFHEIVGSLNFIGTPPDSWPVIEYPDPLFVDSLEGVLSELSIWQDDPTYVYEDKSCAFPIAPDYYHKADVSGGMWYNIKLPTKDINPRIEDAPGRPRFIDYFVLAFRFGGFPGLKQHREHGWPLAKLKSGLLKLN